jgi:IS30 family transposase
VRRHIREHGGVRPRWGRELLGRSLSMRERERILELKGQHGVREIARRLGRSPSTMSRELRRDCGVSGYRATRAHALAFELARRPQEAKLNTNEALRIRVQNDLEKNLSPEQISGRLRQISPTIRRCRFLTKRSTHRCMCSHGAD